MKHLLAAFPEVWVLDFEFSIPPGGHPRVLCMVAREQGFGGELRLWRDDLLALPSAPFHPLALLVTYYGSAEFRCFEALGWSTNFHHIDLFAEFRAATNGLPVVSGNGLLGALRYFGLPAMDLDDKEANRALALRGEPYNDAERKRLLAYCRDDVVALERLAPVLLKADPGVVLEHRLLRGRYMRTVARMEQTGVPLDGLQLDRLRAGWDGLLGALVEDVDQSYGVFEGRTFKGERWLAWCARQGILWPLHPSGLPILNEETFKSMAASYPEVERMRQLRHTLGQLRLNDLEVGHDERNRALLSPLRSKTGRNQPSNTRFVFGPSAWIRGLIRPQEGNAVAYLDWSQQEFGIAAYLSGDLNMIAAYEAADPYLKFAELAGAAPAGATKRTHGPERERFKACALAVLYGMGEVALSQRLAVDAAEARWLLELHQQTFREYWRWSDRVRDTALLVGRLDSTFGWPIRVGLDVNERSLRNFPMQANGAEMMRLACILAVEGGVEVCAPVHDALLIHAQLDEIDGRVAQTQQAMAEASAIVLDGPRLKSEAKVVRYPERYMDERPASREMWERVQALLGRLEGACIGATSGVQLRSEPVHVRTPAPSSLFLSTGDYGP